MTHGEDLTPGPQDHLRRSPVHLFVADLDDPVIDAADRHHVDRVLRLRAGQPMTISDGAGRWREARWGADVVVDGPVRVHSAPEPSLRVGFALLKGERNEWVVQKLTELGIDEILPLAAERSVVQWSGERAVRHLERLQRVAREAAMQSRRVILPRVAPLQAPGAVTGDSVALAEPGGPAPSLRRCCVLVGPEGGWSAAELEGRSTIGLGPGVLRAETASMAAGTLLAALRAGLVTGPGFGVSVPAR